MDPVLIELRRNTYSELRRFLKAQGSNHGIADVVDIALRYFIQNFRFEPVPTATGGSWWKGLLMSPGTMLRLSDGRNLRFAEVDGDDLKLDGEPITPGNFARRVTKSRPEAWRDIEILFAGGDVWLTAGSVFPNARGFRRAREKSAKSETK